ncbi:MAG: penicillin-insensitive murein endopeptidase [Rhodobacteraceae bacterium]|nr:penicillin-insensitive murein endopeptidase [Paracoccaceae bacterium]
MIPFSQAGERESNSDGPAKLLFGGVAAPNEAKPQVYGGYANGCVAGALQLAANGAGWQAMRPSRNRGYGHPSLLAFIERLGDNARELGWHGVLVGDLAQPLGGPMLTGHRSHQVGLDADIWFRPAPERRLSSKERESLSSERLVTRNRLQVTKNWRETHGEILKAAASDAAIARIFVNAAIKQRMCGDYGGSDEAIGWLRKLRPWWGHDSHFHVRLNCPEDSPQCVPQDAPPPGDGCDQLAWWFSDEALNPKPKPGAKPRPEITLNDLPEACGALLSSMQR